MLQIGNRHYNDCFKNDCFKWIKQQNTCKSETGADMQVFESSSQDGRMGRTPGNDESAGKIKSTKTPKEIAISNEFLFKGLGASLPKLHI
jgi:hypothetical protein